MSQEEHVASQTLPTDYQLGKFKIVREIGSGGFGVTYKAYDTVLERLVAIKEYFPFNLANRNSSLTVAPKTQVASDVEEFQWGLDGIIKEARALALFGHANIIRVIDSIEQNGTAYIIMEYVDGSDFSTHIKQQLLTIQKTESIVKPVAQGLEVVHGAGMLHRDIKPGNIMIRADGSPVLIDFGAARIAIGSRSQSLSTLLTPGYAPIEQYSSRGNQGPWTDIYALAAVAYVSLTGENLGHYESTERIRNDDLPRLSDAIGAPNNSFIQAIEWGLAPEEKDRPQTVADWLDAMSGTMDPSIVPQGSVPEADATIKVGKGHSKNTSSIGSEGKSGAERADKTTSKLPYLAIVAGLIVASAFIYFAMDFGSVSSDKVVRNALVEKNLDSIEIEDSGIQKSTAAAREEDSRASREQPVAKPKEKDKEKATARNTKQDEYDFSVAVKVATPEAFSIYLRLHPSGLHASEARRRSRSL